MKMERIAFVLIIGGMLLSMVLWAADQFRAEPGETLNMPTDRTAPLEAQLSEMLPYNIIQATVDNDVLTVDIRIPNDDLRRIDPAPFPTVCNIGEATSLVFNGITADERTLETWRYDCS